MINQISGANLPNKLRAFEFFGRRHGRALSDTQKRALKWGLKTHGVHASKELNFDALFGSNCQDYALEIGFGNGSHLLRLAHANPNLGVIGCEPFLNGVAKVCRVLVEKEVKNIRLFPEDVRLLLQVIPKASLSRIFILFPDPWPKKRHHRRRLITAEFLTSLLPLLAESGQIIIATDHQDYFEWIREAVGSVSAIEWINQETPHVLPKGWCDTKYAAKGREKGDIPHYLQLCKR